MPWSYLRLTFWQKLKILTAGWQQSPCDVWGGWHCLWLATHMGQLFRHSSSQWSPPAPHEPPPAPAQGKEGAERELESVRAGQWSQMQERSDKMSIEHSWEVRIEMRDTSDRSVNTDITHQMIKMQLVDLTHLWYFLHIQSVSHIHIVIYCKLVKFSYLIISTLPHRLQSI